MVYSGWKFILFLVFGRMTSNFMCWTFSTLCSSSLWTIGTIFLLLEKAYNTRELTQGRHRETLLPLMRSAKQNKRPPSFKPHLKNAWKKKAPGGLIEDLP